MSMFIFSNNLSTTLASAITNAATTITLSSAANIPTIPAGAYLPITLNDAATKTVYEIMYATAASGTSLTVMRAQEGTTARAWAAGDFVFSTATAASTASSGGNSANRFQVATAVGSSDATPLAQVQALVTAGTAGVASFNSRTGNVTLESTDVTGALGYTPANAAAQVSSFNTRTGAVTLTSGDVTGALGYTPASSASGVSSFNTRTGAVTLTSSDVTGALGFTPLGPTTVFNQLGLSQGSISPSSITWTTATNEISLLVNPTTNYPQGGCAFKFGIAEGTESGWTLNPNASSGNADFVTMYPYVASNAARARIWAMNPVAETEPGYDATAWCVEGNVNNDSNSSPPQVYGATNHKLGFVFVSGGSYPITAAFVATAVAGANSNYTNYFSQSAINQHFWAAAGNVDGATAFLDSSNASTCLAVTAGTKTAGIDLAAGTATYSSGIAIRVPNNVGICAKNAAGTGVVGLGAVDSTNSVLIGINAASINFYNGIIPEVDNSYNCGSSANRWAAIWSATGTIQTSDPSLKTDISNLPEALPLVQALNPKTYKWKVGGQEKRTVKVKKLVHAKRIWTEEEERIELVDGQAVRKMVPVEREEYLYDEYPIFNADGTPHMRDIDHGRQGVSTAQAIHRVPRMVEEEVEEGQVVEREGKRTHWGFLATDVRDAFAQLGLDFAGYVKDGGTHHLRPDQLVPVLWKAVQELAARVEALESR